MDILNIDLKKEIDSSYQIQFVENTGEELSAFLQTRGVARVLIVSDSNVFPLHYYTLLSGVSSEIQVDDFVIQAGEEYKTTETVLQICEKLIQLGYNRNDYIVALGGGVVGDIVGFAASIFKRGMNVVQVPTTLLSMFDSSVGGKTGVDFAGVKNIIGNFKQPKKVFINASYLETLPGEEILSGYFEGLKHALLESQKYFDDFKASSIASHLLGEKGDSYISVDDVNEFIGSNVSVKARIVMEDEKEMGVRKFLNYGHTFGHALESVTNFEVSHGVCVAYGMIYVNILSHSLGYLEEIDLLKINDFILGKLSNYSKVGVIKKVSFDEIYEKMKSDKKNVDTAISFTLLDMPGKLHIEKVGDDRRDLLEEVYDRWREFLDL